MKTKILKKISMTVRCEFNDHKCHKILIENTVFLIKKGVN